MMGLGISVQQTDNLYWGSSSPTHDKHERSEIIKGRNAMADYGMK